MNPVQSFFAIFIVGFTIFFLCVMFFPLLMPFLVFLFIIGGAVAGWIYAGKFEVPQNPNQDNQSQNQNQKQDNDQN